MKKATKTRYYILEKAFDLIYRKGYQATSIDEIIATTKVTKGAFYYHFSTKDDMGIAMINEIIRPAIRNVSIIPLQQSLNPFNQIYQVIKSLLLEDPLLTPEHGCPMGNLIQEMTPWKPEFTDVLRKLTEEWENAIENILKEGIENGSIRNDINTKQVASFIISSYWGVRNFGKINGDTKCYHSYLDEMKLYLDNLKKV